MGRGAAVVALGVIFGALLAGCGGDSDAAACRKEREAMLKAGENGLAISTAPACASVDYTEQLRMSRELADELKQR